MFRFNVILAQGWPLFQTALWEALLAMQVDTNAEGCADFPSGFDAPPSEGDVPYRKDGTREQRPNRQTTLLGLGPECRKCNDGVSHFMDLRRPLYCLCVSSPQLPPEKGPNIFHHLHVLPLRRPPLRLLLLFGQTVALITNTPIASFSSFTLRSAT